jgi:hypothetical protein
MSSRTSLDTNVTLDKVHRERFKVCSATLLPYPCAQGLRPVALRLTLSSSLPFSSGLLKNGGISYCPDKQQFQCQRSGICLLLVFTIGDASVDIG